MNKLFSFLKAGVLSSYKSTVIGGLLIAYSLVWGGPLDTWYDFAILVIGCSLVLGKDKWIDAIFKKLGGSTNKNDTDEEGDVPLNDTDSKP